MPVASKLYVTGLNLRMNSKPGTFSLTFFLNLESLTFDQLAHPPYDPVEELPKRAVLLAVTIVPSPQAMTLNKLSPFTSVFAPRNTLFHPLLYESPAWKPSATLF